MSRYHISGTVTNVSGDLLAGVTVQMKRSSIGTTTDSKGYYELNASGSDTLVFSYVGYITQEVPVNGKSNVNVILNVSSSELSQVVVVGYGTQRKENLTAAVDIIDTKQIASRGNANVTEMLQGVSPNLNITPGSTTASEPGGKPSINIRGIGTLTGDYAPYVLVDGVPMDINAVNSNDIQSITVLKDAAAAAIYGSKGAFGVILITTRSGSMKKKIQIGYSNNISFSNPIGRPHMENSLKYITAFDQASINAGLGANFTPENYDRIEKYMAGEIKEETWLMPDSSDWVGNGIWSIAGNGNNDWMYIFYKDITTRQKHNIDISGGGDKTSYYVSAGLWDQPDELRYGGQFYKRYNVTANITSKATDWMTFKFNSKYINERNRYFNTKEGYDRNTFYHDFYRTNSFRPRILPNGEFSDISDIPSLVDGGKIDVYGSQYILSLGAILEPVKNWETVISYNYTNSNSRYDDNKKTIYGTDPRGQKYVHAYPTSSYTSNFVADNNTLFNITSSYNIALDKHDFYVMAGFESQSDLLNGITGSKNDMLTSSVPSISTSTGTINLSDNKSHWASESFFGRFRYNFREKYLLEVNGRYDGSSRFASDSRWGFFPSVSVGYNISQESFWKALKPYVNTFKIRGSWGSLGNQQVPNYLYLPTIGMGTNLNWIVGSVRPDFVQAPGLTSAGLTWETITTKNIGFDAGFLDGRLSAAFDLYTRITSDMFGPAEALPLTLGTSVPQTNNATIKTRGFDLDLTWRDHIGTNITYSVRATISDNVTTVLEYNNPTKSLSTWYEGQTLGEIWGLRTVGIYQSDEDAGKGPDQTLFYPTWGAGDIQYKDLDGDNKITRGSGTADDPGDYTIIGNNSSRYPVGLYGELKWKNIDFSMFWQGILKREYAFARANDNAFYGFNGEQWWGMNAFYKGNNTTLDYWRPGDESNILGPNTQSYYPKPYLSTEDYKNKEIQTRYMQKASYFRLKSLTIGYTVPSNLTRRVAVENARIYVSGENLLTFTPLTKLVDPEALFNSGWGVAKGHFLRRIFSVGINVTFK
jgi:TonB-linked SusC/RagA family outer membrane protein